MTHHITCRLAGPLLLLALVHGPASAAEDSQALATVNGTVLTAGDIERYRERRPESEGTQAELLQELINIELLVQDAERDKLYEGEEFKLEMEMTRRAMLAQFAVRNQVDANPVTEAKMLEIYDEQVGQSAGKTEYHARHILLESEADAKQVIVDLDAGGDFATLAKERSTGPSGPQGGDLGFFEPGQMVPEFSQAATALTPGSYTKAPVQTQFGWHVILLEETRKIDGPSFEQVKPQIENMLQSMQVREYLEGLRSKAKIEMVEAK
ncbi:MAG: peptidylprolyl isomerase [Gammaproteobacteria bacterium]|nr:MAG: peptidylprolyl isomerase [Gammaproteobacteria bacterium]